MKGEARTDTNEFQAGEKKERGSHSGPGAGPGDAGEHSEQASPTTEPGVPETAASEVKGKKDGMQARLDDLNATVATLREQLASLQELCAKGLGTNQWKDEAINRMQKRLDEYERDILRVIQEPLLRDLLLFYDSLTGLLEKSQKQAIKPEAFVKEVGFLRDELEEVFAVQNVTPVATGVHQKYDPKYQKVVRTETAASAEEHEAVTRVVREGFLWGERILRKQHVVAKKWEPVHAVNMQGKSDGSQERAPREEEVKTQDGR